MKLIKIYPSLKEGKTDIFLQNITKEVRQIAAKFHAGAMCELGIFWVIEGKVIRFSKPWNSEYLTKTREVISYDLLHFDAWKDYPLAYKKWTDYPRGRVWFENNCFICELAPSLNNTEIKEKILRSFKLPPEMSESFKDRGTKFEFFAGYDGGLS